MAKLKLGPITDDNPVKVALELPAALHRDLVTYAELLGREGGQLRLVSFAWSIRSSCTWHS